ncbi:MAG: hypothetical protein ACI8O8_002588 [Oleiphilaceae bacterium]|jgi:hypothetical protein
MPDAAQDPALTLHIAGYAYNIQSTHQVMKCSNNL